MKAQILNNPVPVKMPLATVIKILSFTFLFALTPRDHNTVT